MYPNRYNTLSKYPNSTHGVIKFHTSPKIWGDGQTKIRVCSDEPFLEASSGIAKLSHLSFFLEKAAAAWYASSCSGFNSNRNKRGRKINKKLSN